MIVLRTIQQRHLKLQLGYNFNISRFRYCNYTYTEHNTTVTELNVRRMEHCVDIKK